MTDRTAPDLLLFWAMAYKLSDVLLIAEEDGALAALGRGASREELAAATGWRPDSLAVVATLLARAGLVEEQEGRLRLLPGLERYRALVALEGHLAAWHRARDSLRRTLRSGEANDPLDELGDSAFTAAFADAMALTARETALRIRKLLGTGEAGSGSARRIVDLGGGDGSVAVELAGALPEASFVVVDRPALGAAFAARAAARADRIAFQAGDLREAAVVSRAVAGADVVLLLNVAHLLPSGDLDRLLHAARAAATPGATLIVRELFPGEDGPLGLTDLMLVDWLKCGARFCDDAQAFAARLERAGFDRVAVRRVPGGIDSFITAWAG